MWCAVPRPADCSRSLPRWHYTYEILRVSVPSAASTLLTNLTFILLTGLVAPFGTEAIAGYGAGGRLEYLLIPIVFGVGSALVPLVAASDGAGDFASASAVSPAPVRRRAAGACGLVGTAAALFPSAWMGLFTSDDAVVAVGGSYLIRVGPAYAFLGLGLALYFAAQGRGAGAAPPGHPDPAAGRRRPRSLRVAYFPVGDRLAVHPDGLRPGAVRASDGIRGDAARTGRRGDAALSPRHQFGKLPRTGEELAEVLSHSGCPLKKFGRFGDAKMAKLAC